VAVHAALRPARGTGPARRRRPRASTTRSSGWGWTMSTSTSATRIQTSFAATFPTSTSGCSALAST
jgi:hypothetical protein